MEGRSTEQQGNSTAKQKAFTCDSAGKTQNTVNTTNVRILHMWFEGKMLGWRWTEKDGCPNIKAEIHHNGDFTPISVDFLVYNLKNILEEPYSKHCSTLHGIRVVYRQNSIVWFRLIDLSRNTTTNELLNLIKRYQTGLWALNAMIKNSYHMDRICQNKRPFQARFIRHHDHRAPLHSAAAPPGFKTPFYMEKTLGM